MELLSLKSEPFGLDISDLSLKIIKLRKDGKFYALASFGRTAISPGIIEKGEIKNEEALAAIIKEAVNNVKGERLKTKYVIVSLPEEKAFLQVIQLPIMKKEELKKAAYFEAENYLPLSMDEVYFDSQIVLPVHLFDKIQGKLDHIDVLIAALPKKTIDPYISALLKAGLKPIVLEIESQAVSRSLIGNGLSHQPLLLIDIGATRVSFIIFSGHSLRFTSSISISSQKFTQAISENLKIDLKKAEEIKLKYGILGEVKSDEIFEALKPILIDLVEQIKKYLNYYQTHSSREHLSSSFSKERRVEKILLCGGGANLKGLCDFLSLELKIPVEPGNPWINILPKPLKEVPELSYQESLTYTTALGLALRSFK